MSWDSHWMGVWVAELLGWWMQRHEEEKSSVPEDRKA